MSKYYCPKCRREVDTDSKKVTEGYKGFCEECQEDFYEFELFTEDEVKKTSLKFASVHWTVEDVLDLMPSWDRKKATEWLEENEQEIEEQIITEGWNILQNLLPEEEN